MNNYNNPTIMKLREYQIEIGERAAKIIKSKGLVYINAEVRSGKNLMTFQTAKNLNSQNILFITKIKAFKGVLSDYDTFGYKKDFKLSVVNKESLHKELSNDFDLIVLDEAHQYAAFGKASKFQKDIRKRFSGKRIVFLSGTMCPESYSQIYHQFQISDRSPFANYKNFYKWAAEFVNIKVKHMGYAMINDYSNANYSLIKPIISPYVITFTQKEAGFTSEVNEKFLYCDLLPITYRIMETLKKDNVFHGNNDMIIADTGAKIMQKLHQLAGGSIILESGNTQLLDYSKCKLIEKEFGNKKIAIFYKFKGELELLKNYFGERITTDLDEFNNTDKWIAYQFISGREGVNLSAADYLVMYSIDYSATTYFQARDRLTTMNRLSNTVYWIFGNKTIEKKVYESVSNKKTFTYTIFKKTIY